MLAQKMFATILIVSNANVFFREYIIIKIKYITHIKHKSNTSQHIVQKYKNIHIEIKIYMVMKWVYLTFRFILQIIFRKLRIDKKKKLYYIVDQKVNWRTTCIKHSLDSLKNESKRKLNFVSLYFLTYMCMYFYIYVLHTSWLVFPIHFKTSLQALVILLLK